MSAHQAKEVHLECKANGDDPISIMWRRDGQELVAEPGRSSITVIREIQHVTSKFSIFKTHKSDSGRYECQASNPFGKSFYHIHLQIWGKKTSLCSMFIHKICKLKTSLKKMKQAGSARADSPGFFHLQQGRPLDAPNPFIKEKQDSRTCVYPHNKMNEYSNEERILHSR